MMPLALAKPGEAFTICKMCCMDKTQCHLRNLGFVPGCSVELVSSNNGNLICKIKDSRIAIDKGIAMRIMIQPE